MTQLERSQRRVIFSPGVKVGIACPLNASVAAPTADDCTTLVYRRGPAKRTPESFASIRSRSALGPHRQIDLFRTSATSLRVYPDLLR